MLHIDNMTADITKCTDSRQNKVAQTRETQHLVSSEVCKHVKTLLVAFTYSQSHSEVTSIKLCFH